MIPEPTEAWVASKNGAYLGRFEWPMAHEDIAKDMEWKTPPKMLRHEHVVDGFVVIYALPVLGEGRKGSVPMVEHVTYDTEKTA